MQSLFQIFSKLLFLLAGAAIVVLSLLSANRSFSQGKGLQLAQQQLYFEGSVSPDHLLYPAVMVIDRVGLLLADTERKVELKLEYAWRRLEHAEMLLERGYHSLSFSTLTKGYKYYNEALADARQLSLSDRQKLLLQENSQLFEERVQSLFSYFTHAEREELIRLSDQQAALEQF